jgi:hypothetical protein
MGLSDDQIDSLLRSAEERLTESAASTKTKTPASDSRVRSNINAAATQAKQIHTIKSSRGKIGLRIVPEASTARKKKVISLGSHRTLPTQMMRISWKRPSDEDMPPSWTAALLFMTFFTIIVTLIEISTFEIQHLATLGI